MFTEVVERKIRAARVARLATVDSQGRPHIVPVCFAYDGRAFYTPLDGKPKRLAAARLARVRNVRANPRVSLLLDEYDDRDWTQLWYILIRGSGEFLTPPAQRDALRLLREKYIQYASKELLPDDAPVIRITAGSVVSWGVL